MRAPRQRSSAADVEDGFGNLARGIERLGIRLEVALRRDQVDQLLGDVDVRPFDRRRHQIAEAVHAGRAKLRLARQAELPSWRWPAGSVNLASTTLPNVWMSPFEKLALTMPSSPTVTPSS